jgi:hypothetical protein
VFNHAMLMTGGTVVGVIIFVQVWSSIVFGQSSDMGKCRKCCRPSWDGQGGQGTLGKGLGGVKVGLRGAMNRWSIEQKKCQTFTFICI